MFKKGQAVRLKAHPECVGIVEVVQNGARGNEWIVVKWPWSFNPNNTLMSAIEAVPVSMPKTLQEGDRWTNNLGYTYTTNLPLMSTAGYGIVKIERPTGYETVWESDAEDV
jgi:hypothetical protein